MEVARDLESFVRALFRHRVRERTKDLLALLQFLVRFLECLRSEEHLPSKQERRQDRRQAKKSAAL